MAQLHRISGKYFRSFLRQTLTCRYTLVEVIDFLHALVGFCVDPGFVLSPISKLRIVCFFSNTAIDKTKETMSKIQVKSGIPVWEPIWGKPE